MIEYKLSKSQQAVVDCTETYVHFKRGTGATFSVVYGAIKFAEENPGSKIIVFGDNLVGFENRLNEMCGCVDKAIIERYPSPEVGVLKVQVRNKDGAISNILFSRLDRLYDISGIIYDLAYIDSATVDEFQHNTLPCIAQRCCTVKSFEPK